MAEAQPRRHAAKGFGVHHTGQMPHVAERRAGARLDEAERHVLPLGLLPLHTDEVVDGLAHRARHHRDARGQRKPERREGSLPGFAFEVAQSHAKGRRGQPGEADALKERGVKLRRWLGAHGLGRRKFHRLPDGTDDAGKRGARADQKRAENGRRGEVKGEQREAEKAVIDADDIGPHPHPDDRADHQREGHDDEGEFQVVETDLPRGVAKRLELRDLLALEPHEPREHRAAHEGRDAQEDGGKRDGKRAEDIDLVVEPLRRWVVAAVIRDEAAVGREHAVHLGHHRRNRRTRRDIEEHAVERAVELEGVGQLALVHPENAEAPVVRQRVARPRLEDKLRRKRDADDLQSLPRAVDDRSDGVPRREAVRFRESLADHDFIAAAEFREPSTAEEKSVQPLRAVVRQRDDGAIRRLGQPRQIERHISRDPRLHGSHARQPGESRAQGVRRAFQLTEYVSKLVLRVVGVARGFEREDEAPHHDHHRQPAGHDDADGKHLALHFANVAEELQVEGGHGMAEGK